MMDHLRWAPDEASQMLGTGYLRFYSEAGVHGLAKIVGLTELHVLAVSSVTPGTGQFRRFLALCKADCQAVYVWEVWNEELAKTLGRHGFVACDGEHKGEKLTGMVWNRTK